MVTISDNRNCVYTNYRISKISQTSPFCSFCSQNDTQSQCLELVSHLFYNCTIVLNFWQEVGAWLASIDTPVNVSLSQSNILFGILSESSNSLGYFIILCGKYFIWKTKLQSGLPMLNTFKIFLKIN